MNPNFLIWIATVLVTISLSTGGQTAQAEEITAKSKAVIDQLVSSLMKKTKAPGISLAIATDNQIRYAKGFGLADIENQVSVTPETRFRTASIAKSMTTIVVRSLPLMSNNRDALKSHHPDQVASVGFSPFSRPVKYSP